ncbi:MAG: hypothetical protein KBT53_08745, partial [Porticoccus sp.]|nr:hypothetical protein [Porticoccus sp.]
MKYFISIMLVLLLVGCAEPLPDDKNNFVGLWKSNQTSLLVTKSGRIEYESNKGAVKTSVSMPIKSITNSELVAGFLFMKSSFKLLGPPRNKDGATIVTVDGEDLYKIGNDGKVILSLEIPSIKEIRILVTKDLNLLSDAITNQDFSNYLSASSIQFQSQFTNKKLVETYQIFINQNLDLKRWMAGDFFLTKEP